jgi:mono/diheme cytochrome c family protein
MTRAEALLALLLVAACLLAGCGQPAGDLPKAGAQAEKKAAATDAIELDLEGDDDVFAEGESKAPAALAPDAGETGEAIYRRLQCAGCHEVASRPGQPVIPLERLSERYSPETLAAFLAAPKPPMPVFALDAEQRSKLAWYLLAAHP